jgi:hypothetical protein
MNESSEQDISALAEELKTDLRFISEQLFKALQQTGSPATLENARQLWQDVKEQVFVPLDCPLRRAVCLSDCDYWTAGYCTFPESVAQPDHGKIRTN